MKNITAMHMSLITKALNERSIIKQQYVADGQDSEKRIKLEQAKQLRQMI